MFEIRHVEERIGAEAIGIDVKTLDDAGFARIYQALIERNVLIVRDQQLDIPEFIAHGRRFGFLKPHIVKQANDPLIPELTIMDSSAAAEDPKMRANMAIRGSGWHTDLSYEAEAAKATQLYAIALPSYGGDTLFANQYAAYDALPDRLKKRVDGVIVTYLYGGRTKRRVEVLDPADRNRPPVYHPLVRVHPETHRKALYLDMNKYIGIEGMTDAQADELIEEVRDYRVQPGAEYRHKWRLGDLVIWDNRCSLHSATGDGAPNERRAHWRLTIMESRQEQAKAG